MARRSSSPPTLNQILARVHFSIIVMSVLVATLALVISSVIVMREYGQRNRELIADSLSYAVEPALMFGDREAAREAVIATIDPSTIARVEIRDAAGASFVDWRAPTKQLPNALMTSLWGGMTPPPSEQAIHRDKTYIGNVRVYSNPRPVLRFAGAGVMISLWCLGFTLLAARILSRRLQRDVIEPLNHVAEVAHAVRVNRAFDRRVSIAGVAEIDRFGQDFNALLAEMQGWHTGLTSENRELARQASHDALTGLGNRTLFEKNLLDAVNQAARSGQSFAVMYLDIDRFKSINDRFGHEAGDATLVTVAERIRASIRQNDQAFRLGGDEFALLLAPVEVDPSVGVTAVTDRLARAMLHPIRLAEGPDEVVSLSLGCAHYPDDAVSPRDLLRRADAQMYQHKRSRNTAQPVMS